MDESPLCLTYTPLILASKHLVLLDRKMRINLAGSHQREKSGAPAWLTISQKVGLPGTENIRERNWRREFEGCR